MINGAQVPLLRPTPFHKTYAPKKPAPLPSHSPVAPKLVIKDKNGSKLTLDMDGSMTIEALTGLTLKTAGTITLDAAEVDVKVKTFMNVSQSVVS